MRFLPFALLALAACSSSAPTSEPPVTANPETTPDEPVAATSDAPPVAPRSKPANGSEGCGATLTPGVQSLSIDVGGTKRTYVLSVPAAYDALTAYRVVFVFHSGGGTGTRARDYFGFANIAEDKAIFVYPDGRSGNWDLETPADANADVAFVEAIVASLAKSACVDASKVFATGSSNGAYFVNQLGCRRGASLLRAIAPHSGSGPYDQGSAYDADGHLQCAGKPVPAMIFHGLADTNVSPADGQATVDHWSWANGCTSSTKPTAPSPCVAFDGCRSPVVSCRIPNQGHRIWAQGPQATWDFFASF